MMSYLPKGELEPDKGGKKGPSSARLTLWIVVSAIGLYMIGSGIYGLLSK
jgi:hypothetical protein